VKADQSERALILAPFGRDALVASAMLAEKNIRSAICANLSELVAELHLGAGFAIITEEVLRSADLHALARWIGAQPEWSDFPFVLLTGKEGGIERNPDAARLLETLGNVTFLERPFHPTTLISLAQAAIRGRQRQYDARGRLEALRQLNETLEARIAAAVAEQKVVEAALRQAQKMEAVGQLTGGVAHDFNNLLMAISGGLSMLERSSVDPQRRQRIRDGMRQAVERGAALTRQLLAFSRRKPLEPKPLDLQRQILGMKELLDRSLRGDVEVEIASAEGLWPIYADPGELELAILNLCVNARDALPSGGAIRVSVANGVSTTGRVRGDVVRLSVHDDGVGMSEEVIAHVFEPFFTTKDVGKGSGLGLAQVYAFLAQSGGEVAIKSKVGQGTTVTLVFPRATQKPETESSIPEFSATAAPVEAGGATGHVLLVEDDEEVAALTVEMLDSIGYEVTHVSSPSAALGALANGRVFDIVFSDVMMAGGMSGVELAREIRRRRPGLPIVLATGYVEAAQGAVEEGLAVLAKPYQIEALAQVLRRQMALLPH
jgi:signal transduction histidine kinase